MKVASKTMSFNYLINLYGKGKFAIPPYQRNLVWDSHKKKDLIDSFTSGRNIGWIVLHLKENGVYDIIDGQQRVDTLVNYYLQNSSANELNELEGLLNIEIKYEEITDATYLEAHTYYTELNSGKPLTGGRDKEGVCHARD